MTEPSDEELMRCYVQEADRHAFEQIFARYASRLLGMFRRSGCSDPIAQDMLQQTFLHVHRARNDFRLDGRLRPWVFAIGMNVRREYFRKRKRRPETQLDLDKHREPSVDPAASTATDRLVRRAIAELPDSQREVILLHWFEELSFREISAIVGASLSAVKVRAHRGYERLREALGTEP